MRDYLEGHAQDLLGRVAVVHYEDLPARRSLPAGTYIFSALDQLSPAGLGLMLELEQQLARAGGLARILNAPSRTLLRYALLAELRRAGWNRHGAARATGDLSGLRFPVFLREEHQHTGPISPLVHDGAGLRRELGRALLRGYSLEELLVVEFFDAAGPDAIYRRYPAFIIGSQIIPRGLSQGPNWMLKFEEAKFTEASLLEERAYVLGNPHEADLRKVFELAGRVEYGRVDYAVKDGRLEVWEINLNPTIVLARGAAAPNLPEALLPLREVATRHFHTRCRAAFVSLDEDSPRGGTFEIAYSAEALRRLGAMIRPRHRPARLGGVLRGLGSLRPLLDGAAGVVGSWLAGAARRMRRDDR